MTDVEVRKTDYLLFKILLPGLFTILTLLGGYYVADVRAENESLRVRMSAHETWRAEVSAWQAGVDASRFTAQDGLKLSEKFTELFGSLDASVKLVDDRLIRVIDDVAEVKVLLNKLADG